MKIRRRFRPRIACVSLFFYSVALCYFPVMISSRVVTLDSIDIFRTNEWLPTKPTVYFQCKGENKTALPDVKKKHVSYRFKGEESWQLQINPVSRKMHWILIVIISTSVLMVFIAGLVSAYKYWQRRKRQQQQARFLKLFGENDDIEDELGIGPLRVI